MLIAHPRRAVVRGDARFANARSAQDERVFMFSRNPMPSHLEAPRFCAALMRVGVLQLAQVPSAPALEALGVCAVWVTARWRRLSVAGCGVSSTGGDHDGFTALTFMNSGTWLHRDRGLSLFGRGSSMVSISSPASLKACA